ncbi:MAG: PAS domain S-box protein [Desulfobacteraceae bacterium]|nr:PAS domain S-box protein [Desulfobacteraceae bacterium]
MERNDGFYQLLAEYSSDLVTLHSPDGVCMYVSPACRDLIGYGPEELVGRMPSEFFHSDDLEIKGLETIPGKERFHTRPYRIRHKNGHYVWVETTGRTVMKSGAGEAGSIVATTRDLGWGKSLERQTIPSENKDRLFEEYEKVLESTPNMVCVVDREYTFRMVNHAYLAYRGAKRDEVIGRKAFELLPENVFNQTVRSFLEKSFKGERVKYEMEYAHPDKGPRWLEVNYYPIKGIDSEEVDRVAALILDITEKKQFLKELQEKEEKFRLITETVQDVFWVSTPGIQEMLYVSPAYETAWGRSRKRLYEEPHSFLDAIHPDDRKKFRNFEALHARGVWNYEYRILRPDKSVAWVQDRGYPVTDDAGNIRFLVGVAADVTELKQFQEELKKINRNLDKKVKNRTADLENANRELQEKTETLRELNTALRVVIDNKDEAREDLKEHVISHLKTHIVPYLDKLKLSSLDPLQETYVKVIEFNIEQAFDPLVSKLNSRYFNLSPAEIKIANLIKIGKTSKEIAGVMNISKGTVDWHRIQIRKKMGLQNKKISLRNKLCSLK